MADTKETGLPPNWEVRFSNSKELPYYFNTADAGSQWVPPEGTDSEQLEAWIDKHHEIYVVHLLVKHNQSRRKESWREAKITRSKEEARKIIEGYRERIVEHAGFLVGKDKPLVKQGDPPGKYSRIEALRKALGDLAVTESDCSSAFEGGDLGLFTKLGMQKQFVDVAFALQIGELSGVVETDSGLHLILRLRKPSPEVLEEARKAKEAKKAKKAKDAKDAKKANSDG